MRACAANRQMASENRLYVLELYASGRTTACANDIFQLRRRNWRCVSPHLVRHLSLVQFDMDDGRSLTSRQNAVVDRCCLSSWPHGARTGVVKWRHLRAHLTVRVSQRA
jgi:hypothetical protein